MVQQSSEIVFCDSTSTLDRFGNSMFIISTTHACCSIPLGVIIVSDKKQETIKEGLKMLRRVLPTSAFYCRGVHVGPALFMTDDSTAEREALQSGWKPSRLLLSIFHFLQRRWTCLHNEKNRIPQKDRLYLIKIIKSLVYSKSENELNGQYTKLQNDHIFIRYPSFLQHKKSLWPTRREWIICYRHADLTISNHTNNYAEAGIKVAKIWSSAE